MGTRGKRKPIVEQTGSDLAESSLVLLRSAEDLRRLGAQHGCYENLALDIEKLVQFIPDVKLEYIKC